jgi:N utilization substance protein A
MVRNALSPATIDNIKFDKKNKVAKVWVPENQLSLAIGKGGQNVRLASKLTGWEIDIVKEGEKSDQKAQDEKTMSNKKEGTNEGKNNISGEKREQRKKNE